MTEITVDTVYEMRSTGRIGVDNVSKPRYVEVEEFNGVLSLMKGTYRVSFNEGVEEGIIHSTEDLESIGAFLLPRRVGGEGEGELQTTLVCHRSIELEPDAPIGEVSIEETLDMANVEECIDGKMQNISRYLKSGSVEDTA